MASKIKVLFAVRPLWLLVAAMLLALIVGVFIPTAPDFRGPLLSIENTILIAGLVALGALVGNLYMQRGQDLARIGKLEDDLKSAQRDLQTFRNENSTLRDTLAAAASFINRVGLWIAKSRSGPMPQPPQQLEPHIDTELWESSAIDVTD